DGFTVSLHDALPISRGRSPLRRSEGATLATAEGPTSYRLVGVAPSDPAVGFKSLARHHEIGSGICSLDPASNFMVFGGFRAGCCLLHEPARGCSRWS